MNPRSWIVFSIVIYCNDCHGLADYAGLTDCIENKETKFNLTTLEGILHIDCARKCYLTSNCMFLFYVPATRTCCMLIRTLDDVEMTEDADSRCFKKNAIGSGGAMPRREDNSKINETILPENRTKVSKGRDIAECLVTNVINAPPSYHCCPPLNLIGPADSRAWGTGRHKVFLKVGFRTKMYVEQVHIYEPHHYGHVIKVSLLSPMGTWKDVWNKSQHWQQIRWGSKKGRIFSPDIEITGFTTSSMQIDFLGRGSAVDAVKILGREIHSPL